MLTRKFIPYGATFAALAAALVIAIALTLTLVGGGSAAAEDDWDSMTVEVVNAHITLNVLPAPSAAYFIVIGDITEVDGEPASGTYYCKGLITDTDFFGLPALVAGTPDPDGISFVDQRFRIDGVGTIIGAGAENSDQPLAITGGTGKFTGVQGSYTAVGLPIEAGGTGNLSFQFNIGDDSDGDDDDDS